jgi:hypothetical protein
MKSTSPGAETGPMLHCRTMHSSHGVAGESWSLVPIILIIWHVDFFKRFQLILGWRATFQNWGRFGQRRAAKGEFKRVAETALPLYLKTLACVYFNSLFNSISAVGWM